jgi:hypothetical protein
MFRLTCKLKLAQSIYAFQSIHTSWRPNVSWCLFVWTRAVNNVLLNMLQTFKDTPVGPSCGSRSSDHTQQVHTAKKNVGCACFLFLPHEMLTKSRAPSLPVIRCRFTSNDQVSIHFQWWGSSNRPLHWTLRCTYLLALTGPKTRNLL